MYETWDRAWSRAYSYGHNVPRLTGKRLDHFARAYADICDGVGGSPDLGIFFQEWAEGRTYEGTAGEHWYPAVA